MDSEERVYRPANRCPGCRRSMGASALCSTCLGAIEDDDGPGVIRCYAHRGASLFQPRAKPRLTLRATDWYTFGDAVEAARELEWWLDPCNKHALLAEPKRAWVEAIIPMLYAGKRTLPLPAEFCVQTHWQIDVLTRAQERGLPFELA